VPSDKTLEFLFSSLRPSTFCKLEGGQKYFGRPNCLFLQVWSGTSVAVRGGSSLHPESM